MATAKPFSRMETAEHREPYDARVSRTVLGARRGDFPRATHQVVVSVAGTKHWLWWAVDQDGFVLDVLVQSRRNAKAARRLMRKLLKVQGCAPRVMITDKLGSYAVAGRETMPGLLARQFSALARLRNTDPTVAITLRSAADMPPCNTARFFANFADLAWRRLRWSRRSVKMTGDRFASSAFRTSSKIRSLRRNTLPASIDVCAQER